MPVIPRKISSDGKPDQRDQLLLDLANRVSLLSVEVRQLRLLVVTHFNGSKKDWYEEPKRVAGAHGSYGGPDENDLPF